jgi:hypothetical protein
LESLLKTGDWMCGNEHEMVVGRESPVVPNETYD